MTIAKDELNDFHGDYLDDSSEVKNIKQLQILLKDRAKGMSLNKLLDKDYDLSQKLNVDLYKHLDDWKQVRFENSFQKWYMYVQFQQKIDSLFESHHKISYIEKLRYSEVTKASRYIFNNMQIYEKVFGLLYLHPCF